MPRPPAFAVGGGVGAGAGTNGPVVHPLEPLTPPSSAKGKDWPQSMAGRINTTTPLHFESKPPLFSYHFSLCAGATAAEWRLFMRRSSLTCHYSRMPLYALLAGMSYCRMSCLVAFYTVIYVMEIHGLPWKRIGVAIETYCCCQ